MVQNVSDSCHKVHVKELQSLLAHMHEQLPTISGPIGVACAVASEGTYVTLLIC